MILPETEALKRIAALPRGREPRIKWAGYDLPGETADGGLLVVGTTGTGKTTMLAQTLHSLLPNFQNEAKHRAIVFDPKGDLLTLLRAHLPPSKLIVFDWAKENSTVWDIATDIQSRAEARMLAEALVPKAQQQTPFFESAASTVLAHVIDALNDTQPNAWTLSHLLNIVSKRESLKQILDSKNSPLTSDANTFDNIRATLANALAGYELVAARWSQSQPKISFKAWLRQGDTVLVVLGNPILTAPEGLLRAALLGVIASTLGSLPDELGGWRLWIFSDDVKFFGESGTFASLAHRRSAGIRHILSLRSIEEVNAADSSPNRGMEFLSQFTTISWLKLDSFETAKWASAGTSGVVSPSEFIDLPYPASRVVTGIHLIRGIGGVFKGTADYNASSGGDKH